MVIPGKEKQDIEKYNKKTDTKYLLFKFERSNNRIKKTWEKKNAEKFIQTVPISISYGKPS